MATKPVEVRRDPENENRVAIKTGRGVTAGAWFVFDADNGGSYSDGKREGVTDWTVVD